MNITTLEAMLERGQDNALLRFTLGNLLYKQKNYEKAALHLSRAVELDPDYSAAWKIYGRTLAATGELPEAARAFKQGIAVAEKRGDVQAAREMTVFLRRLEKNYPQMTQINADESMGSE